MYVVREKDILYENHSLGLEVYLLLNRNTNNTEKSIYFKINT